MAAMDRDTFIPLGTSIVKLLLIASGQGALATAVGEGAGLLAKFRRTLEIGGNRAVFAEKIADDAAKQLLREHQGISEADWHMAARQAASLIDRLSEKERLAAGYNWEELRRTLLDLGGTDLRSGLADESARQAFDWVLEVACQRIADCFTEKEALASILESVEEVRSGIQRLAERPAGASQTRAVVADHLEVVRDLAPDPLEDREREIAELTAFVHGAPDAWYAMEAGMISGKTALMSSFTLNPPSDVHIVSFFIRRMGGDGNDWRSFSFVAGAQLAEILGDEYTERVSEPASQNTEFRQLLRRAATACQSDKNPRPLVLVIDGVDEDSYYEDPDAPDAKSILSLLPRHLPEGVKLVTASRPNPRMLEDIVCNASRVVVSLKPSPIAQEKINQKDVETFFKSDLAVDIGAFLAACGDSLTIDELRQLIARHRHLENVPSRDVKACVDHSPGRMLMRVNVGFGDREIPSYTLGHDAVLRSVLHEIAPHLVGECGGVEDAVWWAQIRDKALTPYREVVRKWVEDQADEGWSVVTPNYLLSGACFNLMLNHDVQVVLDPGRYNEMWRRFGRRALVLRMIDGECLEAMDANLEGISEDVMISLLWVAEAKMELACMSAYVPGLCRLQVSHFDVTPDAVLDEVLSVGSPNSRLNALAEAMKAALECGRGCAFLPILPVVLESLAVCRDLGDKVLRLLVDVVTSVDCVVNGSKSNGFESFDLEAWVNEIQVYVNRERFLLSLSSSCRSVDEVGEGAHLIAPLCLAEDMAERIEDSQERVRALVGVAEALSRAGHADQALAVAERIEHPTLRAWALGRVAEALSRAGETDRARQVADNAASAAGRIEDLERRVRALVGVAEALSQAGTTDEALKIVSAINDPASRSLALSPVVKELVRKGSSDDAAEAMRAELAWVKGVAERQDAAGCCTTLAEACADASDLVDSESTMRGQWLGLARSALARSWLYGASVWGHFGILMRVAPELAVQLVDERLLTDSGSGTAAESDPDLGPEGPGGDAGSYR